MEPNGHAAAGALTPATVEVVTNDHSNNEENTRSQRSAKTEPTVMPQEISRFMPVMDIGQALQRRQAIVDATQKLMRPGVDFGKVPGTERDVLLQPGADKLCNLFGLVIQYEVAKLEEDCTGERHDGTGRARYREYATQRYHSPDFFAPTFFAGLPIFNLPRGVSQ